MHKHKLKNLLLLIIRLLIILCLLLALANPILKVFTHQLSKPDLSVALLHNGIYGGILDRDGNNLIKHQIDRLRQFDSSNGTQTKIEPLIEAPENSEKNIQRFGNYRDALIRALKKIPATATTLQYQIPVFAWEELMGIEDILKQALDNHPGLSIAFLDYQKWAENLRAFKNLKSIPHENAPMLKLLINIDQNAYVRAKDLQSKMSLFINNSLFSEMDFAENSMDISVPYGSESKTIGKFSSRLTDFAAPDYYFSFPKADNGIVVHVGSTLTSLPSLGRENYFRKIIHLPDFKNIPWSKKINTIFLANGKGIDPENYSRLVAYVKQGGKLIIATGEETDVALLNRFLLQPFHMGRLRNVLSATTKEAAALQNTSAVWTQELSKNLGKIGAIKKYFEFLPDSGNQILISQKITPMLENGITKSFAPILIEQDFYAGKILLWTTDIDHLDWTEIGVGTTVPFFHRAFQNSDLENRTVNLATASDSIFSFSLFQTTMKGDVRILDPEGDLFTNFRIERNQIYIGPFDRLGLYQLLQPKLGSAAQIDTTFFAANLSNTLTVNPDSKANFLKTLSMHKSRVSVVATTGILGMNNPTQALWKWLIFAAILLLFAESIIALFFSANRERS